jgi:hypothetical protein
MSGRDCSTSVSRLASRASTQTSGADLGGGGGGGGGGGRGPRPVPAVAAAGAAEDPAEQPVGGHPEQLRERDQGDQDHHPDDQYQRNLHVPRSLQDAPSAQWYRDLDTVR